MSLQATTSQTVGPYFLIGMNWLFRDDLAGPGVAGERIVIAGRVLDADGQGVPDAVLVFMRGLLRRLVTRIYFPGEPANASDFALNLVETGRRSTLIATGSKPHAGHLEWNVVLQGRDETVFFDC